MNPREQVLGADGDPVPGLYAVGNSTAAPTGQGSISGGLTFGPILTFGYLAARGAVQEPGRQATGLHATGPTR